jgi:hypothetical protein
MKRNGFEGWYFKHQRGRCETMAFIPGRSRSGAFIQFASNHGSGYYEVPDIYVDNHKIRGGGCVFSMSGIEVDLPHISGKLSYGPIKRLRSDIMGPFRYLPLQCRHGVVSMRHTLNGTLRFRGRDICFDGGLGYIEKDSGASFPKD